MTTRKLDYRPELDGLRALAVTGVLLFHLDRGWLPGGFVGVDVFFVLSGFLITSILLHDCDTGTFSFVRFYQRRIARILPALVVVALTTVGASALVYSSFDFAKVGANLVVVSLSVANVKYIFQGNYFETPSDSQPLLHYWSLSVEEQFYVVFPIVLFLLVRHARRRLSLAILISGAISLVACIALTRSHPIWAFYLLPTRAWELLVGAWLAVRPHGVCAHSGARSFLPWLPAGGLLLLAGSFLLIHEGPGFPGWQAIFPVLGAAAIVHRRDPASTPHRVTRFLSSLPMTTLGKMSYSLYLWHWPVFCLIDYHFYLTSDPVRIAMKTGLTLALTVLTYRFIEKPCRNLFSHPGRRSLTYASAIAIVALSVALGTSIRTSEYINAAASEVRAGGKSFEAKPGSDSLILMGDSNGSMYGAVTRAICHDLGLTLNVISVDAGDPLPRGDGSTTQLWIDSLERVRQVKPRYLVLANHWVEKLAGDRERLAKAIQELQPHVGHILLLNQPPILPREASRASLRAGARPPFREETSIRDRRRDVNRYLLQLQSEGLTVIDIASQFESPDGTIVVTNDEGQLLYQDATHLSGYGARRVRTTLEKAIGQH